MNAPLDENTAAEAGQQLVGLKKTLEEATQQIGSLQALLATQQHLEQLLKQGRAHLQEMRARLQQATGERDQLQSRIDGLQTDVQRRLALTEVLDRHRAICPRCRCPEAVVLIDAQFEVTWQCVDCETRWPASDDETALLLGSNLKTIH